MWCVPTAIGCGPGGVTGKGGSAHRARAKYLDRKRAGWRAHARLLDELRVGPCADCGGRFPPCAMDFDHRDSATKTKGVTRLVGRAGASRIIAEAAKCDIVCATATALEPTTDGWPIDSRAGEAQLVERQPSKLDVAGSNPVSRSISLSQSMAGPRRERLASRRRRRRATAVRWQPCGSLAGISATRSPSGVGTIRRGTTWRLSIQTSPFSRRLFHRLGPENGGRSSFDQSESGVRRSWRSLG